MINEQILEELYHKYYESTLDSNVTSSYWKEIGKHNVQKINGKFSLEGGAFGHFRRNNLKSKIYFSIELGLTRYLALKFKADPQISKLAKDICNRSGRLYDFDCLKQVLTLQFIRTEIDSNKINTICIIGDGYGFLGQLCKQLWPTKNIISINIGKTLFFDVFYTLNDFSNTKHKLLSDQDHLLSNGINFIEAENYELIEKLNIDLFINIASMQEINNIVIKKYFELMRSSRANKKYFYCCNREHKVLPDGEVTQISKYPWQDWTILKSEICPWYQEFPTHKPPFWKNYDGSLRHILAQI